MSVSHQWSFTLKRDEGSLTIKESAAPSSSSEVVLDVNVAAATTRQLVSAAWTSGKLKSLLLQSTQAITLYVNGTNEVQQVAVSGSPTGGTFTLTFGGNTTAAIAFNATASTVQAALQALASIGSGNVACAGGPLPGTAVSVTFQAALGLQDVAAMTHTDSLTGGSTPAVAITTPTPGVAPSQTVSMAANVPMIWLSDWAPWYACPISSATVTQLGITNAGTAQATITGRILSTP